MRTVLLILLVLSSLVLIGNTPPRDTIPEVPTIPVLIQKIITAGEKITTLETTVSNQATIITSLNTVVEKQKVVIFDLEKINALNDRKLLYRDEELGIYKGVIKNFTSLPEPEGDKWYEKRTVNYILGVLTGATVVYLGAVIVSKIK